MTNSTPVDAFTDEEIHDICRALGSKAHTLERGVARAKGKGLMELARNLEKSLDKWVRLLNKAKEFDYVDNLD